MNEVIIALSSALGGGLITHGLGWLTGRRGRELDEVDIISKISAQLRGELFKESERQKDTIGILRRVIINLTGLLDEVFPRIDGITEDEKQRLRNANIDARLAGLAATI